MQGGCGLVFLEAHPAQRRKHPLAQSVVVFGFGFARAGSCRWRHAGRFGLRRGRLGLRNERPRAIRRAFSPSRSLATLAGDVLGAVSLSSRVLIVRATEQTQILGIE